MGQVKIYAVGDIMPGDSPLYYGVGTRSAKKKDDLYMFEYVEDILKDADIRIGNLESPLSNKIDNSYKNGQLIGDMNFINDLKRCNFNILNIANNHALQHGEEKFMETMDYLSSNKIEPIGLLKQDILIKQINDVRIGFLGISLRPEQHQSNNNSYEYIIDNIFKIVSEYRKKLDFIVLSIHWGEEYMKYPSKEQVKLAHELSDSGVDIILGHHPHVLQGIEIYKNSLIAYSLGNYVSDMCQNDAKLSMILEIELSRNKVIKHKVHGCIINEKYQPVFIDESKRKDYCNHIVSLNYKIINIEKYDDKRYKEEVLQSIQSFRKEYRSFLKKNFFKYPLRNLIKIIYYAILRKIGGVFKYVKCNL